MDQLIVKDGELYLNDDDILLRRYDEGDCDTISFPFKSDQDRVNLASALFDSYECGEIQGRTVLLPNGEKFSIDENLK